MPYVLLAIYTLVALTALLNLLLMRRPSGKPGRARLCVLIPARNEEANLTRLLPSLLSPNPGLDILVFDDESDDATALVAKNLGADVVTPSESLPTGWTGKNRACHLLAAAAEHLDADWILFLDADVRPSPAFISAIQDLCDSAPKKTGVITGFPTILPGRGIEPLFLAWVGWVLLAFNPYGVVNRTGVGHSRFKNGQIHCWRKEVYTRIRPNERVRSRIMEDVMIGRLLAREGIGVEVANLSGVIAVKMYDTWRETLDGMSKNSYEITNTDWGSILIALFLFLMGWTWMFAGSLSLLSLGLLCVSGLFVALVARSAKWPILLMPLVPTIGAFTVLRSMAWHRRGTVHWKGRTYDPKNIGT